MKWRALLALLGSALVATAAFAWAAGPASTKPDSAEVAAVRKALRPMQVIVGRWRGNTFRENVVHEADWAWDHKTDPKRPALVMTSAKHPFFHKARLTFVPADETYELVLTEPTGAIRRFEGRFTERPEDVPGNDGQSLQRTYEVRFDQVEPTAGTRWQIVLNQQENNRFLFELARRRGQGPFRRFDTVSSQREGTSFALTDEGYGEKTCIISGGLGTIAVSHAGRTYYVCCSGCKAAFDDDPEKWIAAYAESQSETKK